MKLTISKKTFYSLLLIIIIIALPITLYALSQRQDVRQSAQVAQNPPSCIGKTAINLVIDKSYSMGHSAGGATKMVILKGALNQFIDVLSSMDEDFYIGIDVFGAPNDPPNGAFTEFDFVKYSTNKSMIENEINNLSVGVLGGTYMRSGFDVAINKINNAKLRPELQGYKFVTVVFSDGVPEMQGASGADCVAESYSGGTYVCFAKAQDPRLSSPSRVTQMKQITDKVYSVVIYNSTSGSRGYSLNNELLDLMRDISDDPDSQYFYNATVSNSDKLSEIFQTIPQVICDPTHTPTPSPTITPTRTPTPIIPTPSACIVPQSPQGLKIDCPFCGL